MSAHQWTFKKKDPITNTSSEDSCSQHVEQAQPPFNNLFLVEDFPTRARQVHRPVLASVGELLDPDCL